MHASWLRFIVFAMLAALGCAVHTATFGAVLESGSDAHGGLRYCDSRLCFELSSNPLRYRIETRGGRTLVTSAAATARDPVVNADYLRDNDVVDGIDRSYPGFPRVSYRPLAYLTNDWQAANGVISAEADGLDVHLQLRTSDGFGADLDVSFGDDDTLELDFAPHAPGVVATADALALSASGYYGAGQRFGAFDLAGQRVPLWISHGAGSDGKRSTNEIAASFFWTPDGWGLWSRGDARGEMNFGQAGERRDASNVVRETAVLQLRYYTGTPRQILSRYTADSGRPQWTPPEWMWRPMVWQDDDTSTESVLALVNGMQQRGIPLGAVWLDNPWDAGKGSFEFDPARFPEPDAMIAAVHDAGVRLLVWMSPFMTDTYADFAAAQGWLVTGTRADGNDATYYPPRSISPHLDFTNADATSWWRTQLQGLIARGVDGLKLDRCEEDLSDDSQWANASPNRDNHNGYCARYHRAAFDAFRAQRADDDFMLIARGGWSGGAQWTGQWAADNLSLPGEPGMKQALRSLLSLSISGFPFSGADIGGYAGTRQDAGADGPRLGLPSVATYARWTQLGALSPVMQTDVPPWWIGDRAVAIYRRYARLHDALAPYTARHARAAIEDGIPIVRPMRYAYPDDARAAEFPEQYLYGDDLLVSPVVDVVTGVRSAEKSVYLPPGDWVDFWTGEIFAGPVVRSRQYPLEELPLFVRAGARLPNGVAAARS